MGALALLLVASCFVGGVFSARMAKLALDDSASVSDASASSADQQQELESVVSALAHMNADSEAMRRVLASGVYPPSPAPPSPSPSPPAPPSPSPPLPPGLALEAEHYVAGFSANATIVADLDVTSQASVDAFIAAFIQLTATALNIDPANVYVTRVTKGGASSGRRRAALEQSGAAEHVWSASELSALLPGAGLSLLALKRVTPADDATVAGLRSAKLELVLGPVMGLWHHKAHDVNGSKP
ncbi:hypothetical protein CHLRE_08g365141v5 [Chlamydomonas reinhardtii]|uniref:Uncharacterized protein n=1 Tax=Chlamydomonas reinhardtii TaxID=3055 RepID=A0A2K3DGU4_CHLRE|nr:uncharacterized protein CHLRE_08g365141v5 [Chlamydomonas reinhardtii]XP_042921915.1 uncharacterized protein CHLRE_08g365141v5 [Chlamydomonas reinhardtii]PNW79752.1 hypothetical protein CHLRE_08g365141v5 [Chlamydomonas reinhardtii]PNW79753.1 hypothetical protein CHLRE_08g365141v5 [Chlamydomonas reinhardtii]